MGAFATPLTSPSRARVPSWKAGLWSVRSRLWSFDLRKGLGLGFQVFQDPS